MTSTFNVHSTLKFYSLSGMPGSVFIRAHQEDLILSHSTVAAHLNIPSSSCLFLTWPMRKKVAKSTSRSAAETGGPVPHHGAGWLGVGGA